MLPKDHKNYYLAEFRSGIWVRLQIANNTDSQAKGPECGTFPFRDLPFLQCVSDLHHQSDRPAGRGDLICRSGKI